MTKVPTVFVGHGDPRNALDDNEYTQSWAAFGSNLPPLRGVVSVSAHWYIDETAVTSNADQPTIHDFFGFPQEMFEVQYPAPGDPQLAAEVAQLLSQSAGTEVAQRDDWGIDHGTWSVLVHMLPEANVPVIQLSIDATKPPDEHYELGQALRQLRDTGVLVMGSGNLVHNLQETMLSGYESAPAPWSAEFDADIKQAVLDGDHATVIHYRDHPAAGRAVPIPDHFLPLLYFLGALEPGEVAHTICDGLFGAGISMVAFASDS